MKIGKCAKCGETKEVREHHYKGYGIEETKPYCRSCDAKAHIKAKKEGRCKLTSEESRLLSSRSAAKRSDSKIWEFNQRECKGIQLRETLSFYLDGNIKWKSWFHIGR